MLNVISLDEARRQMLAHFCPYCPKCESVPLAQAAGRVLAQRVDASEWVPGFTRSTMDGYALRAADTFGCSDSLPAQLALAGEVEMGKEPAFVIGAGQCAYIPTGGQLPEGADAVVMVERSEDYGDGTVGILSPCAPGANLIFRGDDVKPGDTLLVTGRRLGAKEIGALAALGVTDVVVSRPLRAAVLSTGDELVPPDAVPLHGQVRDVNGPMLCAALETFGCRVDDLGVVPDHVDALLETVARAAQTHDLVLLSGSSSAGTKDAAQLVLSELGDVLFHGIAVKPGKPTLLADVGGVPVFGLPGHPVAAWFLFRLLVTELLQVWTGLHHSPHIKTLTLAQAIPSNHGREEYVLVQVDGDRAVPLRSKSGLITSLARADGYLCIPRDAEGLAAASPVDITLLWEELL